MCYMGEDLCCEMHIYIYKYIYIYIYIYIYTYIYTQLHTKAVRTRYSQHKLYQMIKDRHR